MICNPAEGLLSKRCLVFGTSKTFGEDEAMATMEFAKELDARGLNCPLPILRAKKALTELKSGDVLKILATDPGSVKDFAAFARQTGNELLSSEEINKEFEFYMRRK